MGHCIHTTGLNYFFSKKEQVLHDIHLHVPEGSIYGFLGPNGAGKTTTLRLLLGLLRRQSGDIHIFGQPFNPNRQSILGRIGSLIESPSLYSHLTARENLMIWQKVYQCPKNRIEAVLRLTGIADTGEKKTGQFSLGMKQRLGIAVALLHAPRLLILDEPTNGLDPGGIVEMRELLRQINQESGITIVISSHLLSEIEKLVTDVGIIHRGKMQFEGPLDELMRVRRSHSSLVIETGAPDKALALAQQTCGEARLINGKINLPHQDKTTIAALNQQFVMADIPVYQITGKEDDLESIFMQMTAATPTQNPLL